MCLKRDDLNSDLQYRVHPANIHIFIGQEALLLLYRPAVQRDSSPLPGPKASLPTRIEPA